MRDCVESADGVVQGRAGLSSSATSLPAAHAATLSFRGRVVPAPPGKRLIMPIIALTTRDGATISGYRADPTGKPRGGVVVVQEIFGVNAHIRSVCDFYAGEGYVAVAPALYDRIEPGFETGYAPDDMQRGFAMRARTQPADVLADVEAAVRVASQGGKVGIVGYCWGGAVAYAAACHAPGLGAAVSYYGGGLVTLIGDRPKCPVMLHFSDRDAHIPMTDVGKIAAALPDAPLYLYAADHGFNCDARAAYDAEAARLARERTLSFFAEHL